MESVGPNHGAKEKSLPQSNLEANQTYNESSNVHDNVEPFEKELDLSLLIKEDFTGEDIVKMLENGSNLVMSKEIYHDKVVGIPHEQEYSVKELPYNAENVCSLDIDYSGDKEYLLVESVASQNSP